jgi:hypothetical protein
MMKIPASYKQLDRLTDISPVGEALAERREELRRQMVAQRDAHELARIQGRAEEIDLLLDAIFATRGMTAPARRNET